MEIWKPINGIEGHKYQVSNHGRVRSLSRAVQRKSGGVMIFGSRILKPTVNHKGYLVVYPSSNKVDGYKKSLLIHRIVAEAFIPNPEGKPQVNHKDANKANNFEDNLEWATNDENHQHKLDNGLYPDSHMPKPVGQFTKSGELVNTFTSIYAAAKSVGTTQYGISRVVNGLRETCKGFVWKYVDKV